MRRGGHPSTNPQHLRSSHLHYRSQTSSPAAATLLFLLARTMKLEGGSSGSTSTDAPGNYADGVKPNTVADESYEGTGLKVRHFFFCQKLLGFFLILYISRNFSPKLFAFWIGEWWAVWRHYRLHLYACIPAWYCAQLRNLSFLHRTI